MQEKNRHHSQRCVRIARASGEHSRRNIAVDSTQDARRVRRPGFHERTVAHEFLMNSFAFFQAIFIKTPVQKTHQNTIRVILL
jgi:hypothetical protein